MGDVHEGQRGGSDAFQPAHAAHLRQIKLQPPAAAKQRCQMQAASLAQQFAGSGQQREVREARWRQGAALGCRCRRGLFEGHSRRESLRRRAGRRWRRWAHTHARTSLQVEAHGAGHAQPPSAPKIEALTGRAASVSYRTRLP